MNYVPFSITKTLSKLNNRRCKGLCLWCDEQFTANHDCEKAPFIVSIINDVEDEEDVEFNKENGNSVDVEDFSWSYEENQKIQGSFDEMQQNDKEDI